MRFDIRDRASRHLPGVLLIINDIVADIENEFNDWYQDEHLNERLSLDGFLTARRYRSFDGGPSYMTVYECDSVDALCSDAYREKLENPTEWTKRIMPGFRNMLRSACRETWTAGNGIGGDVILVKCKPVMGCEAAARRFVSRTLAPALFASRGILKLSLWETDPEITGPPSKETVLRGGRDNAADWVLFLESYDVAKAALVLHTQMLNSDASATGLLIGQWSRYRLICSIARCTMPAPNFSNVIPYPSP